MKRIVKTNSHRWEAVKAEGESLQRCNQCCNFTKAELCTLRETAENNLVPRKIQKAKHGFNRSNYKYHIAD